MAQIWEYIKIALMNIRSNKGRSILTMLGIIIGIASVITIISVGDGVKGGINSELNDISGGQIYLYSSGRGDGSYIDFTDEDIEAIREKVPHVKAVTSDWSFPASFTGRKGTFEGLAKMGTSGYQYLSGDPMIKGRYFSDNDYYAGKKVCILTEGSARKLFGTSNVVGMTLEVTLYGLSQDFTIIGIRQDNASLLSGMLETDQISMECPSSVLESIFGFSLAFNDIVIVSEGPEYSARVAAEALRLMENRHDVRGQNAIQIQNFDDYMGQITQIVEYITLFVALVAAISLLVGGIGVMNIMLVSVTERTREIGIRKALGARTGSILLQFLSESAIITLLGGIIGIVLGILGAWLICHAMNIGLKVSITTVLLASAFSSGVGIFFGIYPARKAAKLSPIEALRHE